MQNGNSENVCNRRNRGKQKEIGKKREKEEERKRERKRGGKGGRKEENIICR